MLCASLGGRLGFCRKTLQAYQRYVYATLGFSTKDALKKETQPLKYGTEHAELRLMQVDDRKNLETLFSCSDDLVVESENKMRDFKRCCTLAAYLDNMMQYRFIEKT